MYNIFSFTLNYFFTNYKFYISLLKSFKSKHPIVNLIPAIQIIFTNFILTFSSQNRVKQKIIFQ